MKKRCTVFGKSNMLLIASVISFFLLLISAFAKALISSEIGRMLLKLIETLSASFLMGVLVYYLTVYLQNKKSRRRRIWELVDYFKCLDDAYAVIPTRREDIDLHEFCNIFTEDIKNEFDEKLSKALREGRIYEPIMTELECELMGEIWKIRDVEVPNDYMDEKLKESNREKLLTILKDIECLNNGINKEII